MIRWLAQLLVRVILETAVVFLAVALVLLVVAFRIGRRVVTPDPDRFEGLSGKALQLASLLPARTSRGRSGRVDSDPILEAEDEGELA